MSRHPIAYGIYAGLAFLAVAEVLLAFVPWLRGQDIRLLKNADTIALLSGVVTAFGLSALFFQLKAAALAEAQRAQDAKRQSALQLDGLHAHFNSQEMRAHRNLAYDFLRYLLRHPDDLKAYARYWVLDVYYAGHVPTRQQIDQLFGAPAEAGSNPLPAGAERSFDDYDKAVSSIVAFYVRLSLHVGPISSPQQTDSAAVLDDFAREAVGPFFWSPYWRTKLLALAQACEDAVLEESARRIEANKRGRAEAVSAPTQPVGRGLDPWEFEVPYFVTPLRRLDGMLGRRGEA